MCCTHAAPSNGPQYCQVSATARYCQISRVQRTVVSRMFFNGVDVLPSRRCSLHGLTCQVTGEQRCAWRHRCDECPRRRRFVITNVLGSGVGQPVSAVALRATACLRVVCCVFFKGCVRLHDDHFSVRMLLFEVARSSHGATLTDAES